MLSGLLSPCGLPRSDERRDSSQCFPDGLRIAVERFPNLGINLDEAHLAAELLCEIPARADFSVFGHSVSFGQGSLYDPDARLEADATKTGRLVLIGLSSEARLLFVVLAEIHEDVVRIISARKASPAHRKRYGQTR